MIDTRVAVAGALLALLLIALVVMLARRRPASPEELPPLPVAAPGSISTPAVYRVPEECLLHQPPFKRSVLHQIAPLVLLFANAVLFTPYTQVGEMYNVISIAGQTVETPPMFYLSLQRAVADFWNAGAQWLAVLICLGAFVWPYLRLIIMFLILVLPPSVLPPRWAERLLRLVNATAKLEMIDFAMLTELMVAFKLNVSILSSWPSPVSGTAASRPMLEVMIRVLALPGYMASPAFSSALAIITSQLILSMMQSALVHPVDPPNPKAIKSEPTNGHGSLRAHQFATKARGCINVTACGKDGRVCLVVQMLIPLLLIGCAVLNLYATFAINAFSVTFEGLIGALVTEPKRTFVVADIGMMLPDVMGPHASTVVAWTFTIIFFATVVVVPLVTSLLLAALYLLPLSTPNQRRLARLAEAAFAWSLLDTFTAIFVMGANEMPKYAAYKMRAECDLVNPYLHYFAYALNDVPECIKLEIGLQIGTWLIFGSLIITIAVGLLVLQLARRAIREREQLEAKKSNPYGQAVAQMSMNSYGLPDETH